MGGPTVTTTPTRINGTGFTFIVDYSELAEPPGGAALVLVCKSCRALFHSDYEEKWCAACVKRRELVPQS